MSPAVNPVQQVETAVETQTQQVMGGDGFSFTGPLQLEHLR